MTSSVLGRSFSFFCFLFIYVFISTLPSCHCSGPASGQILPSQGDLCSILQHRTAVLGTRLYFMGGSYTFFDGDTNSNGLSSQNLVSMGFILTILTEHELYWLDLNTSFPVEGLISHNSLFSVPATGDQLAGSGAFFVDVQETTLYSFGGFAEGSSDQTDQLLSYDVSKNSWFNASVLGGKYNEYQWDTSMHATSQAGGQGLSFINGGDNGTTGGMIVFNASDTSQLSWTNETGPTVPSTIGASMSYLRYGTQGVLIGMGGTNVGHQGSVTCPLLTLKADLFDSAYS